MQENDNHTTPYASILVKLLQGVVYQESAREWDLLLKYQTPVKDYFLKMKVDLLIDEQEGFAFLTQRDKEDQEDRESVPRLIRRMPLSYEVTLLCVLLRERLLEFDTRQRDSARLILAHDEIIEMIQSFIPERNDEVKLVSKLEAIISRTVDLGFLKVLKGAAGTEYEVRRILKAKMNADQLAEIKEILDLSDAQPTNRTDI